MVIGTIIREAENIKKTYGEDAGVFDIMHGEKIISILFSMGDDAASCKGFILNSYGRAAITVNSDLSEELQKIVFYHEVAHYFLHVKPGIMENVTDSALYDRVSETELEANLLAAELQIADRDVMEALSEYGDVYATAESLNVPAELLQFKLRVMRAKGISIPEMDLGEKPTYLAEIHDRMQF